MCAGQRKVARKSAPRLAKYPRRYPVAPEG
jgi:hypothetical protein